MHFMVALTVKFNSMIFSVKKRAYNEWKFINFSHLFVYGHSKLCVVYFTKYLDFLLKKDDVKNVKIVSICPGVVKTNIGKDIIV